MIAIYDIEGMLVASESGMHMSYIDNDICYLYVNVSKTNMLYVIYVNGCDLL